MKKESQFNRKIVGLSNVLVFHGSLTHNKKEATLSTVISLTITNIQIRKLPSISYLQNMSNKFKIEYYHKLPQTTSPYLQLIQAKKKIYSYKNELSRHQKSITQTHNKSINHLAQPSHKPSKTQSHQKQKPRSQKQNSRKKRSHTQQAQERLHESLFLNREIEQSKQANHQATKSLFAVEGYQHSNNAHQFWKNYKNLLQPQERNLKSYTQQVQSRRLSRDKPTYYQPNPLDKLEINEIDDLITFIDNCVQEANDYIGYLTGKIQTLNKENSMMRAQQLKMLKMKDGIISEKEAEIDFLKRERHTHQNLKAEAQKTFQIKKLLEIVDKISEQNSVLKSKLKQFETGEPRGTYKQYPQKQKKDIQRQKKDIYNEIHNKIDILNISIDKKNHESLRGEDPLRQSKKGKTNKPKFYK